MNKKKFRDAVRLGWAMIFSPIYIPHLVIYFFLRKEIIDSDIAANRHLMKINPGRFLSLIFLLHNNSYFRRLFYYRLGPAFSYAISWYRPGDKYFNISFATKIGPGMRLFHPYATILNAESIGSNFSCLQLTTLGASQKGKPIIGNDVSLGANVTVIGNVTIGDNVEIGAGSVVVKDIPSDSIAVGVPAKVIRPRPLPSRH